MSEHAEKLEGRPVVRVTEVNPARIFSAEKHSE